MDVWRIELAEIDAAIVVLLLLSGQNGKVR